MTRHDECPLPHPAPRGTPVSEAPAYTRRDVTDGAPMLRASTSASASSLRLQVVQVEDGEYAHFTCTLHSAGD